MDANTFLSDPQIKNVLAEAFSLIVDAGDTFNVTETRTDGYYNHVTIVDQDEEGKSFSKTLKLSNIGAGCVSYGNAALHIAAVLYCIVNEDEIIGSTDIEHYAAVLSETISNVKNVGIASVASF